MLEQPSSRYVFHNKAGIVMRDEGTMRVISRQALKTWGKHAEHQSHWILVFRIANRGRAKLAEVHKRSRALIEWEAAQISTSKETDTVHRKDRQQTVFLNMVLTHAEHSESL